MKWKKIYHLTLNFGCWCPRNTSRNTRRGFAPRGSVPVSSRSSAKPNIQRLALVKVKGLERRIHWTRRRRVRCWPWRCTCRRGIDESRAAPNSGQCVLHSFVFGDDVVLVATQRLSTILNLCDGIIVKFRSFKEDGKILITDHYHSIWDLGWPRIRTVNSICWPLQKVVSFNPCRILGTRNSARAVNLFD